MIFDCPRKELHEAVAATASAASGRTSLEILLNLKFTAENGAVTVTGCDGEMWVIRTVPAMVAEPGEACLPAKMLGEILAQLPNKDITINASDEQGAILTLGPSEYRLPVAPAEDFPAWPDFGGDGELTLPMGDLRAAVDSVAFAVSTDHHRQLLQGVYLNYNGAELTLVATDTHRLAVRKITAEGLGASTACVIPEKALRAIRALPVDDDAAIELRFGGNRVGVSIDSARVVSQLINGTYPNWERVVPSESTRAWQVETEPLKENVKRAMIVARDNNNRVRFKGEEDTLTISAKSELSVAKEELPIIGENSSIEIAFNGKYIMDVLNVIKEPGVRIEMTESARPAVIRSVENGQHYFCVVMPMALA